jgi:hypothetical protein
MNYGDWIDGYQVQERAPLDYIRGERRRVVGKRYVNGAWSDPWWVYCPDRGWAVAKKWRQPAQTAVDYADGEYRTVEIPAATERVLVPAA